MAARQPPETYGLTHLAILVTDVQRTLRFYKDVFDAEVMYEEKVGPGKNTLEATISLYLSQAAQTTSVNREAFVTSAFVFVNLVTCLLFLNGSGRLEVGFGSKASSCLALLISSFKDPDGYEIEIWYEVLPS